MKPSASNHFYGSSTRFSLLCFKMPDGRRCASAASGACCRLLPWKRSAGVCHSAAAGTLCKSDRSEESRCGRGEQKALSCNDVRMKTSKSLPAGRAAPWRKRSWRQPGSAAPAAGLSTPPPRSPPGLHTKKQLLMRRTFGVVKRLFYIKTDKTDCFFSNVLDIIPVCASAQRATSFYF